VSLATLSIRLQTPTLIGCLLLKNLCCVLLLHRADFRSAKRWDSIKLLKSLSSTRLLSLLFSASVWTGPKALSVISEVHDYSMNLDRSGLTFAKSHLVSDCRGCGGTAEQTLCRGTRVICLQHLLQGCSQVRAVVSENDLLDRGNLPRVH
jgi:hypothetical protein